MTADRAPAVPPRSTGSVRCWSSKNWCRPPSKSMGRQPAPPTTACQSSVARGLHAALAAQSPCPCGRARPAVRRPRQSRHTGPTTDTTATASGISARPPPDKPAAPAWSQNSTARTSDKAPGPTAPAQTRPAAAGRWWTAQSKAGQWTPSAAPECARSGSRRPAASSPGSG